MLRVRCLRGGSRGAEAAHLIGAMVGIMVVSFLSECLRKEATLGRKHMSTKNKECFLLSACFHLRLIILFEKKSQLLHQNSQLNHSLIIRLMHFFVPLHLGVWVTLDSCLAQMRSSWRCWANRGSAISADNVSYRYVYFGAKHTDWSFSGHTFLIWVFFTNQKL